MSENSLWIASMFSKTEQWKSSAEREVLGRGAGILTRGVETVTERIVRQPPGLLRVRRGVTREEAH